MNPVHPLSSHAGSRYIEFGKNQPQYKALPAFVDPQGLVLTEWEPDDQERAALLAGGRLRIWIHTHGHPLQPVSVEVAEKAVLLKQRPPVVHGHRCLTCQRTWECPGDCQFADGRCLQCGTVLADWERAGESADFRSQHTESGDPKSSGPA